jgi:hypothetical protein
LTCHFDFDFDDFFFGIFAPALRASDNPIAIACLRLVTFLPDFPLRNVPALRSVIVFFTLLLAVVFDADFFFAEVVDLRDVDFFAAMFVLLEIDNETRNYSPP